MGVRVSTVGACGNCWRVGPVTMHHSGAGDWFICPECGELTVWDEGTADEASDEPWD